MERVFPWPYPEDPFEGVVPTGVEANVLVVNGEFDYQTAVSGAEDCFDRLELKSGFQKRLVIEPGAGHCVVSEACGRDAMKAMVVNGNFNGISATADGKVNCADTRDVMRSFQSSHRGWNTLTFGTPDIWTSGTGPCIPADIADDTQCAVPELQCSRCYRACIVRTAFKLPQDMLLEAAPALSEALKRGAKQEGGQTEAQSLAAWIKTQNPVVQTLMQGADCDCKKQAHYCAASAARDIAGCDKLKDPDYFESKARQLQGFWTVSDEMGWPTCEITRMFSTPTTTPAPGGEVSGSGSEVSNKLSGSGSEVSGSDSGSDSASGSEVSIGFALQMSWPFASFFLVALHQLG